MIVFAMLFFSVLAVGAVLVIYGTLAKNKWGINLEAVSCHNSAASTPDKRGNRTYTGPVRGTPRAQLLFEGPPIASVANILGDHHAAIAEENKSKRLVSRSEP